jgi:hypothetical protein
LIGHNTSEKCSKSGLELADYSQKEIRRQDGQFNHYVTLIFRLFLSRNAAKIAMPENNIYVNIAGRFFAPSVLEIIRL